MKRFLVISLTTLLPMVLIASLAMLVSCEKKDPVADKTFQPTKLEPLLGKSLRVGSHNMLFEYTEPTVDAQKWVNRLEAIKDLYTRCPVDIIGTQEILGWQCDQLVAWGPYKQFGTTSQHGDEGAAGAEDEHESIFYLRSRIEPLDSGKFWFSKTPSVPSYSWDANHTRMGNWGKFRLKDSGQEFYMVNCHMHVDAPLARVHSGEILLSLIDSFDASLPVIYTGDYNCDVNSEPVRKLTESGFLFDSRALAGKNIFGPVGSLHSFNTAKTPLRRIDHVIVNEKVTVDSYRIVDDELKTGKFTSDHMPVLVDMTF